MAEATLQRHEVAVNSAPQGGTAPVGCAHGILWAGCPHPAYRVVGPGPRAAEGTRRPRQPLQGTVEGGHSRTRAARAFGPKASLHSAWVSGWTGP